MWIGKEYRAACCGHAGPSSLCKTWRMASSNTCFSIRSKDVRPGLTHWNGKEALARSDRQRSKKISFQREPKYQEVCLDRGRLWGAWSYCQSDGGEFRKTATKTLKAQGWLLKSLHKSSSRVRLALLAPPARLQKLHMNYTLHTTGENTLALYGQLYPRKLSEGVELKKTTPNYWPIIGCSLSVMTRNLKSRRQLYCLEGRM